ncbi:MlaD family protein [Mycolicibacter minnesotensis]
MIRNLLSSGALVALMVFSFIMIGYQGVPWYRGDGQWRQATLVVRDANGLIPQSRVLLRGVPVGEVVALSVDKQGVAVQFKYRNSVPVPVDSVFRVESLSALGETYLSIKPTTDTGPMLGDNQRLMADPATVRGTLGELVSAMARLPQNLDPEQVKVIVNELGIAMADTSSIPQLLAGGRRMRDSLIADQDTLRELLIQNQEILKRSGTISTSFSQVPEPMHRALNSVQQLVEGAIDLIYQSGGKYPADIHEVALLLHRVDDWLGEVGPYLYNITEPLVPVMQAVGGALSTIDTSRLLDSAIDSLQTPGAFTIHVVPSK